MASIFLYNSQTVDYIEGWSYLRAILEGMELARSNLESGQAEIDRKYFKGVTFPERAEGPYKWEGYFEDPRFIIDSKGVLRLFGKRLGARADIEAITGRVIEDYSGMTTVDDVHAVEKAYDIPESSEVMARLRSPLPPKPFKRFQFKKKSQPPLIPELVADASLLVREY